MNTFKSPYDSNQIRQGLMNIKQSQMQLLKQLKNQNHILKKYTPADTIYQQKSDSNIYQSSDQGYSLKQNSQNNNNLLSQNKKAGSYLNSNPSLYSYSNYQKDQIKQQDEYFTNKFTSPPSNKSINQNNSMIERQLETMTQQFHRMKKNYFTQKQKNKDMVLHMEFSSSLHNIILKQTLQGIGLQSIKSKVRAQIQNYQSQFSQFKAFGIQQAFNIINLHSDNSILQSRNTSPSRRTPIFPPKSNSNILQNNELLKQINDLKVQLKQISLQKQRKSQLVTLMKSQNDYSISLLNKQLDMKNGKINELFSQLMKIKQSNKTLASQNNDLRTNIDRLKMQLNRNLNKIETLQNFQKKSSQNIEKQHKYMKYLAQLQQKLSNVQKQSKQKTKLIQIHQTNLNKTNQLFKSIKTEHQKLKVEYEQVQKKYKQKGNMLNQLEQKYSKQKFNHNQEVLFINKRNQAQQMSLKQHIQELKKNVQELLKQQEYRKQSEMSLQQLKAHKIQTLKFSKTVDHLWRIKQVEYQNVNQILTQLNSIKTQINIDKRIANTKQNAFQQKTGSLNNMKSNQYVGVQSSGQKVNSNSQERILRVQNKQRISSRSKSKTRSKNQLINNLE